jgi:hypothetical protein
MSSSLVDSQLLATQHSPSEVSSKCRDYDDHFCPKDYSIHIDKHTVIDEKKPFVLYALELQSNYSKYIILKQFISFVRLQ